MSLPFSNSGSATRVIIRFNQDQKLAKTKRFNKLSNWKKKKKKMFWPHSEAPESNFSPAKAMHPYFLTNALGVNRRDKMVIDFFIVSIKAIS